MWELPVNSASDLLDTEAPLNRYTSKHRGGFPVPFLGMKTTSKWQGQLSIFQYLIPYLEVNQSPNFS